jgi:hypothetical protein
MSKGEEVRDLILIGLIREMWNTISTHWNTEYRKIIMFFLSLAPTAMPEPPPQEPEPAKEDEAKPRKYVPPGARAGSSSSSGTPSRLTSRRKRTAPNLHSEDDFPTLGGGGAPDVRSWGNNR